MTYHLDLGFAFQQLEEFSGNGYLVNSRLKTTL